MKVQKVLVVIDPEQETQPALDRVLSLEHLAEIDITLIACDYTEYLVEGYYFDAVDLVRLRQEYLAERKQVLEGVAEPLREQGLNVETMSVWGHPGYEAIINAAVGVQADLIVRHTRQHSALSRLFLTNDDWQLVRCSPFPLLLVKEKPWKEIPQVLAAVDPMHGRDKPIGLDHKILSEAIDLASMMGGKVHVVHSYNQIPLSGEYTRQAEQEHRQAMDTLMADFDLPASQVHIVDEAPEFGLRQLEDKLNADLVVMGAISRNLLSDVFIGNTTEKVVDYLTCDVLVIKPDGFESPVLR